MKNLIENPNPENRLLLYTIALEILKNSEPGSVGLCHCLRDGVYKLYFLNSDHTPWDPFHYLASSYPEIYRHKPTPGVFTDRTSAYWFENDELGHNRRIQVLEQAIEEVKSLI